MNPESLVEELRANLLSQNEMSVFAVLDGASIPDLLPSIDRHRPEFVCLYRGELPQDVQETAPYLVRLERDAPFTTWLLQEGWGKHWGIFALSAGDFRTMRKHFRTFLMIHSHDGKPLYFRYYDPRVLRAFLPTCDSEQLEVLFRSVACYRLEARDPKVLLRYRFDGGALVCDEIPLEEPSAAAGPPTAERR